MRNKYTNFIVKVGMLSAVAIILQYLGTVIGLKVGGFLDVELSDYPAVIGALALGPTAGILIELIKNLVHISVSTTGMVGELANFLVNGVLVFVVGIIYKHLHSRRGALISLAAGTVIMCIAAMLSNLFITLPMFMPGAGFEAKISLIISVITPFNLARGAALSLLTFFTYKPLSPLLHSKLTK